MESRTLNLTKGGHKYLFCYSPGGEGQIIDEIMHLAEDASSPLDWVDAATLSYQVARYASTDCGETLRPVGKPQS